MLYSYRIAGYFPRCKFSRISRMSSQLGKIYAGLLIRFNYGFNVAIAIMVLYVGASVDEWNASIALRLFI